MVIYIEERQMTGQKRCFPTSKVVEHLNDATIKKRLSENPLNVEHILSKQALTPEQLKQYLDNPLAGRSSLEVLCQSFAFRKVFEFLFFPSSMKLVYYL